MKRAIIKVIIIMIMLISFQEESSGIMGAAQVLSIPIGGRANAMGQAYVAAVDDATGITWNPAGIAFCQSKRRLDFMHTQLVPGLADDVYLEFLGYITKSERLMGSIGGGLIYLTYGKFTASTEERGDIGTFNPYEFVPMITYGFKASENFGFGITLKYIYSYLAPSWAIPDASKPGEGSTFALDFGYLHRNIFNVKGLSFGLQLSNFGPDLAYIDKDEADPIPQNLKIGFAYKIIDLPEYSILLTADLNKILIYNVGKDEERDPFYKAIITSWNDNDSFSEELKQIVRNIGAEVRIGDVLFLRAGYIYDGDGQIYDFTYGVGFKYGMFGFDYANIPQHKDIGRNVSKFSFYAQF